MFTNFHNLPTAALKFNPTIFITKNNLYSDQARRIFHLFLFILALTISSSAATFTVNSSDDGADTTRGDGICASGANAVCTLRAAVQEANALAGDDVINFDATLANQTITLSPNIANEIRIRSNIVIDAAGLAGLVVARDVANSNSRIFSVMSNSTVTMNNFTIAGGRILVDVASGGGGIFSRNSNLTLNNMTIQNNGVVATGNGGGIYVSGGTLNLNNSNVNNNFVTAATTGGGGVYATNRAVVNVNNSRISNNTALLDGGGILNTGGATLNLTESTVNSNFALGLGGGVANRAVALVVTRANIRRSLINGNSPLLGVVGTLGGGAVSNVGTDVISDAIMTIANSTITNNSTTAEGGGLSNTLGDMNLTNNTISNNNSTVGGGGIVNVAGVLGIGTVYVRNNIVANNNDLVGTDIIGTDVLGIFNSLGNNLIGSNFSAEASFEASAFVGVTPQPNAKADLVGGVAAGNQVIDPLLGPLQDNGGPTNTRAITNASPAFNKANSCVFDNTCAVNPQGNNPPSALTTDQRSTGFTRFSGAAVDIGAFEVPLGATAAGVTVAGRVFDGRRGVARAFVYLSDFNGDVRTAITNQFGYYRFDDVPVGKTYILEVRSKQYLYSPQVMNLIEEQLDFNFTPADFGLKGARIY